MSKNLKNLSFRLIAMILGFSAAFGLAEMAVRVFRPQEVGPQRFSFNAKLGEIPVPGQKGRRIFPGVFDFNYSNNSQGFRGSREYDPKKPGIIRILLLGDSFTYGTGVNDDQTFACRLEQHLQQLHPTMQVINAGCPGKGTDYELKLFQTVGAKLQPEVTILCFFPNDFQDNARGEYYNLSVDSGLQVKPLENGREGVKTFLGQFPGYSWLISWSQAANLVKQATVDYLISGSYDPGDSAPGTGVPRVAQSASGLVISYSYTGEQFSNDANRKVTEVYVAHLREAVKQAGSSLVFCYIPAAAEVVAYRRTQAASPDEKAIKAIIEARGEKLYSFTPVLAAAPGTIGDLYFLDGHWTSRAHSIAAGYLAGILKPYFEGNSALRPPLPQPAQFAEDSSTGGRSR